MPNWLLLLVFPIQQLQECVSKIILFLAVIALAWIRNKWAYYNLCNTALKTATLFRGICDCYSNYNSIFVLPNLISSFLPTKAVVKRNWNILCFHAVQTSPSAFNKKDSLATGKNSTIAIWHCLMYNCLSHSLIWLWAVGTLS